jgi:hypothetical protein
MYLCKNLKLRKLKEHIKLMLVKLSHGLDFSFLLEVEG